MKFYIHKLGCPKNDVDADYIAARLIDAGHQPVTQPDQAESIVVNTCGFILPAKEESINELIRLGELKKDGRLKSLYATGCLSQRYGDDMLKEISELDGAFGHGALESIATAVGAASHADKAVRLEPRKLAYLSWKHRFISDPYPWTYLKVSDGCDRGCTYCAIPGMRGRFRSRPLDSILNEAQFLADNGKRELILVSQEATLWGYDMKGQPGVLDLLRELDRIDGIEWIRLMYLYPAALKREHIEYIADDTNKTVNYFDLPLQHINSDILTGMRRNVNRPEIEQELNTIREVSDDSVIRTTFIVGFPGETEGRYEELRTFVEDFEFDRMGVFTYSPEEGTPAEQYDNQVEEEVKQERLDELMSIQREIAFDKNLALVGKTLDVMIDTVSQGDMSVGRTAGDCPEIDQEVYVSGDKFEVGQICRVRIDSADGYDLRGNKVGVRK